MPRMQGEDIDRMARTFEVGGRVDSGWNLIISLRQHCLFSHFWGRRICCQDIHYNIKRLFPILIIIHSARRPRPGRNYPNWMPTRAVDTIISKRCVFIGLVLGMFIGEAAAAAVVAQAYRFPRTQTNNVILWFICILLKAKWVSSQISIAVREASLSSANVWR